MKLKIFKAFFVLVLCLLISLIFAQAAGAELLSNPGFESGATSWSPMGSSMVVDVAFAHSGTKGCRDYNRSNAQSCVAQDVKALLMANGQGNFTVGAWVRLASGTDTVKVGVRLVDGGGAHYCFTSFAANNSSWASGSGTINISWTGTMTEAQFYVSTTASLADIFVDDCSLTKNSVTTPTPTKTPSLTTPSQTRTPSSITPTATKTPSGITPTPSNSYFSATPLMDMGTGSYKGYTGGLYSGGSNQPPSNYLQTGLNCAGLVQPLDGNGIPNTNGRIVLLSIGMSNTTMEFSYFKPVADSDPQKNPKLTIVDGAIGGQDAETIKNPSAPYWTDVDSRLSASGVNAKQVQAIWLKEAIAQENNPFPTDALNLKTDLQQIITIIKQRYPNVKLIYLSSRTYAGYATSTLNPEPYAYESGFAVKWVIEEHINSAEAGNAPWIAWGPYLWTNGTRGRSDGLVWTINDVQPSDGTHPSTSGDKKVSDLLLSFFKTDVTAKGWFLAN